MQRTAPQVEINAVRYAVGGAETEIRKMQWSTNQALVVHKNIHHFILVRMFHVVHIWWFCFLF